MANIKISKFIMPKRVIQKKRLYKIVELTPQFYIKGFTIKTHNNIIYSVIINALHPNCNPETGEFCIPYELTTKPVTKDSIQLIENMLSCFDLDDCYFTPIKGVDINFVKEEGVI